MDLRALYIGGPTAVLELAGGRFLTDPTFDPAGRDYRLPGYTLRKTRGPALEPNALGRIDAVLLSHDHHVDNLDRAGRAVLGKAPVVYTTVPGAGALGSHAVGLHPWDTVTCPTSQGRVAITATPARHGPANNDRGPVIGFLLHASGGGPAVYYSGDTVWYEGVEDVGRRFRIGVAFLNMGAAKLPAAGPAPLTFTAREAVLLARAWPGALLVPLHFEGWDHLTEGRPDIEAAFAEAGLGARLRWLVAGEATSLS